MLAKVLRNEQVPPLDPGAFCVEAFVCSYGWIIFSLDSGCVSQLTLDRQIRQDDSRQGKAWHVIHYLSVQ